MSDWLVREPSSSRATLGSGPLGFLEFSSGDMSYDQGGAGRVLGTEWEAPIVNEMVLQQLMQMGFGRNRAIRALYFGGPNVSSAVSWVCDHKDDANIDEKLLIRRRKQLTREEFMQQAEENRRRTELHYKNAENTACKTPGMEIASSRKETQTAKQRERELARKKWLEEKKKERLEEQHARERVRMQLEEDKRRRRRKQGLPEELTDREKAALEEKRRQREAEEAAETEAAKFVEPIGTLSELRNILVDMKRALRNETVFKAACNALLKYLGNVARCPDDGRFRRIRLDNAVFQRSVATVPGGTHFLELCGFKMDWWGQSLIMPRHAVNQDLLNGVGLILHSGINNPFFGSM